MVVFDKEGINKFCDKLWCCLGIEEFVWGDEDLNSALKHPELLEGYEYLSSSVFEAMKLRIQGIYSNFLGDILGDIIVSDSINVAWKTHKSEIEGFWDSYDKLLNGNIGVSNFEKHTKEEYLFKTKRFFKTFNC